MIFDGDRHELGTYVREMADLCGLRDWYLDLGDGEPDDDDAGADCTVTYGQKHARIRFRDDWKTWEPERLRWLTVHELLHCHLWPMEQRVCDVRNTIGATAYELWSLAFRHDLERAIDGIAREWATTLPLPVKAKKRKRKEAA